jgi:hypothetical protein
MRKLIILFLVFSLNIYGAAPTGYKNETATAKTYAQDLVFPNNQLTKQAGLDSRIETGNYNLLVNPSFEHSTILTGWTKNGGPTHTAVADTSNAVEGKTALLLTFASSAAELTQATTLNAANISGMQGMLSVSIKTQIQDLKVCPKINNIKQTSLCLNVVGDNTYRKYIIPFILGGTSNAILIEKSSSSAGATYIDDAFLGLSSPFQNVNGAKLVGTVTITGCAAVWTTTSTTFAEFGTQTGCTYSVSGQAQAPSTNIPAIKFASLPAGEYRLEYEGAIRQTTANLSAYYQFWDGTNTARETSQIVSQGGTIWTPGISQSISYSSNQSNVTLSIRGKTDSGGTTSILGTTSSPGVIKVYYFPPESKIYTESTGGWTLDGNISGSLISLGTASVGSYSEITNASMSLSVSSGSSSAEIACASGTASTGSTCSSNESIGIAFTPPKIGTYNVCFDFNHYGDTAAGTAPATLFSIAETSNTSSSVLVQGLDVKTSQRSVTGANNLGTIPIRTCSNFYFNSLSKRTLRLMYKQSAWSYNSRLANDGEGVHFSVVPVSTEIVGSFAGIEKCANDYECTDTFSATVSAAGVVSNENLDWINGNCSVVSTSTYTCTLNTNLKDGTSALSSPLNCTVLPYQTTQVLTVQTITPVITTDIKYRTTITGSATAFAEAASIICTKGANDYKPKTAKIATSIGVPTVPGVTTTGTGNTIDTFSFSYGTTNATTVCSASPCSYLDQIGTAVTSVTRNSQGNYTPNFSKTYAKVKCTGFSANGGTNVAPIYAGNLTCTNCNSINFSTAQSGVGVLDTYGTIVCQGAY